MPSFEERLRGWGQNFIPRTKDYFGTFRNDIFPKFVGGYGSGIDLYTPFVTDPIGGFRSGWRNTNEGGILARLGGGMGGFMDASLGAVKGLPGAFAEAWKANQWAGRVGLVAGVGAPILAGAAMYSGLANLRRGRFARGLVGLAAGSALAASMYYGLRTLDAAANNNSA